MKLNKKIAAGVGAGAILVAGSGAAYAFWSAGGSGHGDGSVANPNLATTGVSIQSVSVPTALTPGGSSAVTASVHNANSYSVGIHGLTGVPSLDAASVTAGCSLSDFHVTAVTLGGAAASTLASTPVRVLAASGGTDGMSPITATLSMDDTAVSQDACKNATVTVTFTAS
jgi:hypothetical protein